MGQANLALISQSKLKKSHIMHIEMYCVSLLNIRTFRNCLHHKWLYSVKSFRFIHTWLIWGSCSLTAPPTPKMSSLYGRMSTQQLHLDVWQNKRVKIHKISIKPPKIALMMPWPYYIPVIPKLRIKLFSKSQKLPLTSVSHLLCLRLEMNFTLNRIWVLKKSVSSWRCSSKHFDKETLCWLKGSCDYMHNFLGLVVFFVVTVVVVLP